MPFLGKYPKDPKGAPEYHKETCSTMFIEALFVIARNWKQCSCPSTKGLIKKMWAIYRFEYYSAIKNQDIMNFAGKQIIYYMVMSLHNIC